MICSECQKDKVNEIKTFTFKILASTIELPSMILVSHEALSKCKITLK